MLTEQETQHCPLLQAIWNKPGITKLELVERGLVPLTHTTFVARTKLSGYIAEGKVLPHAGRYYPYTPEYIARFSPAKKAPDLHVYHDPSVIEEFDPKELSVNRPDENTVIFGEFPKRRYPEADWAFDKPEKITWAVTWFSSPRVQQGAIIRCLAAIEQLTNLGKPFTYETIEQVALVPSGFVRETDKVRQKAAQAIAKVNRAQEQVPCN